LIYLQKYFSNINLSYFPAVSYNLDYYYDDPFQDTGEKFDHVWETGKPKSIQIPLDSKIDFSLFRYFLDGSRRTYKIGDVVTAHGQFLPIVAGQIGVAVCERTAGRLKSFFLKRENVICIPNAIFGPEKTQLKNDLLRDLNNLHIGTTFNVIEYTPFPKHQIPGTVPERQENKPIAKIQDRMMNLELETLDSMVKQNLLKPNRMLVIDGSLQFAETDIDDLFYNVVGISKSFCPNLDLVKSKAGKAEIGAVLPKLKEGFRTPVYLYNKTLENGMPRKIGAWYLRIRPRDKVHNPLAGIVKLEKIAVEEKEKNKDFGFDSSLINNISQSVYFERNATCYGLDSRWASHIYAMFLTERYIKSSFLSDTFFLHIFKG
jgi:hypothetical protein